MKIVIFKKDIKYCYIKKASNHFLKNEMLKI